MSTPNKSYGPLTASLTCDVLIIGAGVAGLHTAYELLSKGREVVVIDDGHVTSGESGRTTAMLNNVPDDHLYTIQSMHGKQAAKVVHESMQAALQRMHDISVAEAIDCDWEWLDAYLICGCDAAHPDYAKEVTSLHKDLAACHEAGFTAAHLIDQLDRSLMPGINAGQALVYPRQGQYHPVKYLNGLAEAIVKRGGRIYTETHAQEIKGGSEAQVKTSSGHVIKPHVIVQATNIPSHTTSNTHTHTHTHSPHHTTPRTHPRPQLEPALTIPPLSVSDVPC